MTDSDRIARLDREARVLASLNHPNIATIHGVEDADGIGEPTWAALPAMPSMITRLLRRCLEKDVRRRLHDIADARIEIEDALSYTATEVVAPPTPATRTRASIAAFVLGSLVTGLAAAFVGKRIGSPTVTDAPGPSFSRMHRLTSGPAREWAPAISPDGKWVAYLSNARGPTDVWVKFLAGGRRPHGVQLVPPGSSKSLDRSARWFRGAALTSGPWLDERLSISPDGQQIAFVSDRDGTRALWLINPDGGAPSEVGQCGNHLGPFVVA